MPYRGSRRRPRQSKTCCSSQPLLRLSFRYSVPTHHSNYISDELTYYAGLILKLCSIRTCAWGDQLSSPGFGERVAWSIRFTAVVALSRVVDVRWAARSKIFHGRTHGYVIVFLHPRCIFLHLESAYENIDCDRPKSKVNSRNPFFPNCSPKAFRF